MTYDAFDVVIVPFPFTDREVSRRRPAVVLTPSEPYGAQTGHCVIAMITAATGSSWPHDRVIADPEAAGLRRSCVMRMKLFTVDQRLILARAGRLGDEDRAAARSAIRDLFGIRGSDVHSE